MNSTLTITVNSTGGTQIFTEAPPFGGGQAFFTLLADAGVKINRFTLTSTDGFTDFRQPRISGAALNATPLATPEPSQTAARGFGLMGLAGLALKAHKRKAAAV